MNYYSNTMEYISTIYDKFISLTEPLHKYLGIRYFAFFRVFKSGEYWSGPACLDSL